MAYGKLAVLKTYGEKPAFVILDKDENILAIIPDFSEWAFTKIGKIVSLFESNAYFQLVDQEELNKQ